MFQHQNLWLPDGETHFPVWMDKAGEIVDGVGSYQIKKYRAAMLHVKQFRVALDVGCHVGSWGMQMAKRFEMTHCFEPVATHRECALRNIVTKDGRTWQMHPYAIGAASGRVAMKLEASSSGGTHINGPGDIEMRTLDSFDLQDVDFIKIDVEGAQLAVVQGAVETLKRCRPCVIVEEKQHVMARNFGTKGTPAVDFLIGLGASMRKELGGDYIVSWD